jgi:hypothetical protein
MTFSTWQTFLKDTKAMEVFVPIVSWDNETGEVRSSHSSRSIYVCTLMLTRLLMRTRVQAITVSYSQQKLSITPIHTSPTLTEAFKANVKVRLPLRRCFCEEVANQPLCVRQVINKYSPYGSTAALRVALDKIQVPLCSSSCVEPVL